jgi:subtilisin family serine protease
MSQTQFQMKVFLALFCFFLAMVKEGISQPIETAKGVLMVKFKSSDALRGKNPTSVLKNIHDEIRLAPLWTESHQHAFQKVLTRNAPSQIESRSLESISRIYTLTFPEHFDETLMIARLQKLDLFEWIEPKYIRQTHAIPNDPLIGTSFSSQNYLDYHRLFQAWDISQGSRDVIIAIIDSGVDYLHPDLANKMWINTGEIPNNALDDDGNGFIDDVIGWDFWQEGSIANPVQDNDPRGEFFVHGTHVAGIAAAATNNGIGIAGIGYNCRYMNLKAGGTQSQPTAVGFGFEALLYAVANGAQVVNCSWGSSGFSSFENEVVNFATAQGVVVIASAGNSGGTTAETEPVYPAAYQNVLSVGAVNHFGGLINQRASFSSYGTTLDVLTAGNGVLSTVFQGEYGLLTGTSMSAPIAAGVAGLLKSLRPTWSAARIRLQLRATAEPLDALNPTNANLLGKGRLNAFQALTRTTPGIEVVQYDYEGATQSLAITLVNHNAPTSNSLSFELQSLNGGVSLTNPFQSSQRLNTGDTLRLTFRLTIRTPDSAPRLLKLSFSDAVAGYNDFAVLRVSNSSWEFLSSVSTRARAMSLASDQSMWIVGESGKVFRSRNGGVSFERCVSPTVQNLDAVSAIDSLTAIVGEGESASSGRIAARLFKTVDGGRSWSVVYQGELGAWWNGIAMISRNTGYAMSDAPQNQARFLVVKTNDGGETWNALPNAPISNGDFGWTRSIYFVNALVGFFGGASNGNLYKTFDGGATWQVESTGGGYVGSVFFYDEETGLRVSNNQPHLRRFSEGTWRDIASMNTPLEAATGIPATSRAWVAGNQTVWNSTDGGKTFREESLPIEGNDKLIQLLARKEGNNAIAFALTEGGQLFTQITDLESGQPPSSERPICELSQNYPNPFNSVTAIEYRIFETGFVSLKVYDVLGREVATLVSGVQRAGGYTVKYNATELSSGMYFYRLQVGRASATKAMILVK